MYYTPLLDRERGTHLELLIEVPAESKVELTYDFEKAILRYTEYPPDANRGFDVPAAVIRVLPFIRGGKQVGPGEYLRTTSLLLPLPTPDFSMPYNVIILTSTVIALGFGSIFNLLVRRFVLIDEVPPQPVVEKVKRGIRLVNERIARLKAKESKEAGNAGGDVKVANEAKDYVNSANGRPKEQSKKDR
jgi:phosphatidylinositol glycan class T